MLIIFRIVKRSIAETENKADKLKTMLRYRLAKASTVDNALRLHGCTYRYWKTDGRSLKVLLLLRCCQWWRAQTCYHNQLRSTKARPISQLISQGMQRMGKSSLRPSLALLSILTASFELQVVYWNTPISYHITFRSIKDQVSYLQNQLIDSYDFCNVVEFLVFFKMCPMNSVSRVPNHQSFSQEIGGKAICNSLAGVIPYCGSLNSKL